MNSRYRKAFVAIEYRPEAKDALDSLKDLPNQFKIKYLELLEDNPKGSIEDYINTIKNEFAAWENPYENEDFNKSLQEVRAIGPAAEEEYKKVIHLLGESANLASVVENIKIKNLSSEAVDEKEAIGNLTAKYKVNVIELMKLLNVSYSKGAYHHNGVSYKNFNDALLVAEKYHSGNRIAGLGDLGNFLTNNEGGKTDSSVDDGENLGFWWWQAWAWLGLTLGNLINFSVLAGHQGIMIFSIILNSILMIMALNYNKYAFLAATILSFNLPIWIINGIYLKNRWNHAKVN